jgi:hypothetical protein
MVVCKLSSTSNAPTICVLVQCVLLNIFIQACSPSFLSDKFSVEKTLLKCFGLYTVNGYPFFGYMHEDKHYHLST